MKFTYDEQVLLLVAVRADAYRMEGKAKEMVTEDGTLYFRKEAEALRRLESKILNGCDYE